MKDKHTTFEKIGLFLLIAGLLLLTITMLIVAFKTDIVLGIVVLGLCMTIIGALIYY